jgi:hypothetical protein
MDDKTDAFLMGTGAVTGVLVKIITYVGVFWLGSVVWNWGVADFLGIDYFLSFDKAVVLGFFMRIFFA